MTERYHNDILDSATLILSPGSFSQTHTKLSTIYSFTRLLYFCIFNVSKPINLFLLYILTSLLYCVRLSCLLSRNECVM